MNPRLVYILALSLLSTCLQAEISIAQQSSAPQILQVALPNKQISGMPIQWQSEAILMDNWGSFHFFNTTEVRKHQVLEQEYRPLGLTEARAELLQELGSGFEVFVSGPYVIATPRGQSSRWQNRFNKLLSGYKRYFQVRGWQLQRVDFPLVVIVFPDRASFAAYASRETQSLPAQAVGSYFPRSNRCILYQISGGRQIDWNETEATIVHEAVHQLAYNTGIHERLFQNPFWFVEGLATLFESPAVYELGLDRTQLVDRINRSQWSQLQPLLQDQSKLQRSIEELIASDKPFQKDALNAYALSWAMTFYLTERRPKEYQRIMAVLNQRGLGSYSAAQRQRDFSSATGMSIPMFASQLAGFYQSIGK
ncbi:MAG: DUF1570 domain-containing protein [Planctomycetota bacterium]